MIKKIIYLISFFITIKNIKSIINSEYYENITDILYKNNNYQLSETGYLNNVILSNNCINFTISSRTKCDWLCNYCSINLGTDNFYFEDNVCTYEKGLCTGNPTDEKSYKCCNYWKILYML